jgi:hypothetical protein
MTDTRTPEQIRKEWTAALRSGEYKQGHGRLMQHDGSMCCLGVLHEIVIGKAPPLNRGTPELSVIYKAKLADQNGTATNEIWRLTKSLAEANDAGATFTEIAHIIDSKPHGMFTD